MPNPKITICGEGELGRIVYYQGTLSQEAYQEASDALAARGIEKPLIFVFPSQSDEIPMETLSGDYLFSPKPGNSNFHRIATALGRAGMPSLSVSTDVNSGATYRSVGNLAQALGAGYSIIVTVREADETDSVLSYGQSEATVPNAIVTDNGGNPMAFEIDRLNQIHDIITDTSLDNAQKEDHLMSQIADFPGSSLESLKAFMPPAGSVYRP